MVSRFTLARVLFFLGGIFLPFLSFSQAIPTDSAAGQKKDSSLTIYLNNSDSLNLNNETFRKGWYGTVEDMRRHIPSGRVEDFTLEKFKLRDRKGDSIPVLYIRMINSQYISPSLEQVVAISDGVQTFIKSRNPYLPGVFYPLVYNQGHLYFQMYDGRDPQRPGGWSSVLLGIGTGFSLGPVSFGIGSSMPLSNSNGYSPKNKLPPRHFKWAEFNLNSGSFRILNGPPF